LKLVANKTGSIHRRKIKAFVQSEGNSGIESKSPGGIMRLGGFGPETPRKSSIWPPSGHIFISKLCGEFARKRRGAWHSAYAMFGAIRLQTALSMSSWTTIP